MKQRANYYQGMMSDDYGKLMKLLDENNVVVCFVNYLYDMGNGRKIVYRDVAKAKSNDYNPNTPNYGYVVEARGIIYLSWDRQMQKLRGVTFEDLCEQLKLQFIDAVY